MYVLSFNLALVIDILIFFFRLTNHRFEKMERPHFSVQTCNQTQLKYEKLCLDFFYKAFFREKKFNLIYFQYFVNTNKTEQLCCLFLNTIINGKLIKKIIITIRTFLWTLGLQDLVTTAETLHLAFSSSFSMITTILSKQKY